MTPPSTEAIAAAETEIQRWFAQSPDAGPIGRSVQDAIDKATEALRRELAEEKAMLDWLGANQYLVHGDAMRNILRKEMAKP